MLGGRFHFVDLTITTARVIHASRSIYLVDICSMFLAAGEEGPSFPNVYWFGMLMFRKGHALLCSVRLHREVKLLLLTSRRIPVQLSPYFTFCFWDVVPQGVFTFLPKCVSFVMKFVFLSVNCVAWLISFIILPLVLFEKVTPILWCWIAISYSHLLACWTHCASHWYAIFISCLSTWGCKWI